MTVFDYNPHPEDKNYTVIGLSVRTREGSVGFDTVLSVASAMQECLDLIATKSQGYGEAWREQGWMGNLARIQSKTSRLKNMLWQDHEMGLKEESVEDTLKDLLNLSAFALINRRVANKWGPRV